MKVIYGNLKRRSRTTNKTASFKKLTRTNIETHAKKRAWVPPSLGSLVKIAGDRTMSLYVVIDVADPVWAKCPSVKLMSSHGTLWVLANEILPV